MRIISLSIHFSEMCLPAHLPSNYIPQDDFGCAIWSQPWGGCVNFPSSDPTAAHRVILLQSSLAQGPKIPLVHTFSSSPQNVFCVWWLRWRDRFGLPCPPLLCSWRSICFRTSILAGFVVALGPLTASSG